MTITPNTLTPNACPDFNGILFQFLRQVELDASFVYSDKPEGVPGVPTLGVGYALVVDIGINGAHNWVLRPTLSTDLAAIGITATN